jgi:hypothetical protein
MECCEYGAWAVFEHDFLMEFCDIFKPFFSLHFCVRIRNTFFHAFQMGPLS